MMRVAADGEARRDPPGLTLTLSDIFATADAALRLQRTGWAYIQYRTVRQLFINFRLDQRMERVVRAELHVKAKLALKNIFWLSTSSTNPEFFRIQVYKYIEVASGRPDLPPPQTAAAPTHLTGS